MMLKTVYGPPPKDEERIEDCEFTEESAIQEEKITKEIPDKQQS